MELPVGTADDLLTSRRADYASRRSGRVDELTEVLNAPQRRGMLHQVGDELLEARLPRLALHCLLEGCATLHRHTSRS